MLSVEEAQARVRAAFRPLGTEQVGLSEAVGRVLAEDVVARRTQPPVAVSAMDGYAVRAADVAKVPARLKVVGRVPAGAAWPHPLKPGEAVRIFTGAPLPVGADAIVIQEDADAEDGHVRVREGAAPGRYVRQAGLDFREGEVGLEAGRLLTARDVGLAAAMNVPWLRVRRRPRIAILSTGDEIVMPGEPVGPNQIVSSNGPALAAFVQAHGGVALNLGVVGDDRKAVLARVREAEGSDLLVTSGGVSVGEHDIVQEALKEAGMELAFWRVAMRPGKPLMFGRIAGTAVLGFPGNPVSSIVCAVMFLAPAMRVMLGRPGADPVEQAILGSDVPQNDRRQDYLRARLDRDGDGRLVATPFPKQDSAMLSLLARSDCLVVRPPHAPALEAGAPVPILRLAGG
ncbi:MAG: molybdopterin molybdotransferase MoeA, partial [Rhodospirillaceae bacterium]|nr:molybdopterin molybdotransferase MoeA [Rhodospirillaceae bacterium]